MVSIDDFKVKKDIEIEWGDMDAFQHVNNTRYFKYFENVRVHYGEMIGLRRHMEQSGIGPILAWTDCRFIRPVTFPDTITVGARTLSVQGSEMKIDYAVYSRARGEIAAVGASIGVYYDYRNLKRVDIPEDIISEIEKIEGRKAPRTHTM